ncbi:MAG: molybdopterin-binding protein [Paracoccaceae bacterium]
MKFGEVTPKDAVGAVLAHSVSCGSKRLKKGAVLSQADVDLLLDSGFETISVAQLEESDISENEAAEQLAFALAPEGGAHALERTVPFTGRVNLVASGAGVALVDREKLIAMNALDPMISCATVPHMQQMQKGGLVATVKIISYAVPKEALVRAADLARESISLKTPQLKTASLLITADAPSPSETKAVDVIKTRLDALGVELRDVSMTAHAADEMVQALQTFQSDLLLILTSSATSDVQDTAPRALRQAGGEVERFGMPVDPGNLLFLGELNGRSVIGLPGCARSPALNGADWVMSRVICGIDITAMDFAEMSVGGLLKEIPTRPHPRRKEK